MFLNCLVLFNNSVFKTHQQRLTNEIISKRKKITKTFESRTSKFVTLNRFFQKWHILKA